MRNATTGIAAAVLIVGVWACRANKTEHHYHEPTAAPSTVIIQKEHVHTDNCGHYLYAGKWYSDPEHTRVVVIE